LEAKNRLTIPDCSRNEQSFSLPSVLPASPQFPHTHWTLLKSLEGASDEERQAALNGICKAYWYPLYAAARRKGLGEEDAQDIVQALFLRLLKRGTLLEVDQTKGKLRTFLLAMLDNLMHQQWRTDTRVKRGGGAEHLSWIDVTDAESRLLHAPAQGDQDKLFLRDWASTLLQSSLDRVRDSYQQKQQLDRFELLAPFVTQPEYDRRIVEVAEEQNMTAAHLRVLIYRFRQQYRESIEQEIALTLDTSDPAQIRQEMVELFKAFE
jgi:DNA-directed RNA polymerase specialized sigma24 family protein